jgi:hypothetical protein
MAFLAGAMVAFVLMGCAGQSLSTRENGRLVGGGPGAATGCDIAERG